MSEPEKTAPTKSALATKLESLDAVYQRYGREGLMDYPIADVTLLASKRLLLRDAPTAPRHPNRENGCPRGTGRKPDLPSGLVNAPF